MLSYAPGKVPRIEDLEEGLLMPAVGLEASGLLVESPTGIATYGASLAEALERRSPGACLLLVPWKWWHRRDLVRRRLHVPLCPYLSGRWLHRRVRLVHALDTRLPARYGGILVATVFDVISALPMSASLELSSPRFREKKVRAYEEIARRADAVVTLSEAVRADFLRRFPTKAPVHVIPPGVTSPPRAGNREEVLQKHRVRCPFLLSVGALCPRKNVEGTVRALERAREKFPDLQLVWVGEASFGWQGSRAEDAARRSGAVRLLGYLTRPDLWALYASAEAVLHLSHYEGYGLTVIEALSTGTPVVASDRGGIPEAAGGAAWLVNPDDDGAVDAAVLEVLEGGEAVDRRRESGVAHTGLLTWDSAAQRVQALHASLLGGGPGDEDNPPGIDVRLHPTCR